MGALVLLLLKASLLLAAALLAARLLRRTPAAARHLLWSVVFAAVLSLPILAFTLPALSLRVPAGWEAVPFVRVARDTFREAAGAGIRPIGASRDRSGANIGAIAGGGPTSSASPSLARSERVQSVRVAPWSRGAALLPAAWLAGTTAAAAALFLSLFRVRRLARAADEVSDSAWRCAAATIGARLGLKRRARLLMSARVGTPMAGGVWRPAIFLPASARAWSAEQRDVVLAHEIAHLASHDPLRHFMTRLALAAYWFHPLAWIAASQAAIAREQACDEMVLTLGTRPSAYARVLLDLADSIHPSGPALGALPMVQRSLLERRLMAILNDDVRPVTRRWVAMPAIGVALLALSVAAAQPAASPSSVDVTPAPAPAVIVADATDGPPAVAPPPKVPATAVRTMPAQTDTGRESACWWDSAGGSRVDISLPMSFSGTMSMSDAGGRRVIREAVGQRNGDRVIQKSFGDLRLCMVAEDAGDRAGGERPSQWVGRAARVILEARRGSAVQRLEVGQQTGGLEPTSWRVGGVVRPYDAAAQHWRDRMLAVLDTIWELSSLRGEVSSLRGEISSIHGHRSSLQGEISSLRGEVSTMQGRISSVRGEESSLRGRISSIRGHLSSLRGAISSEQGAISSLDANRYRADGDRARVAGHQAAIARLEQEIRDYGADARVAAVEREIAALDSAGRIAAMEAEIRAFDLNGKVAAVERRIAALDVNGKVAVVERQIDALDADRRGRQLEERRDRELAQLESAIAAIR